MMHESFGVFLALYSFFIVLPGSMAFWGVASRPAWLGATKATIVLLGMAVLALGLPWGVFMAQWQGDVWTCGDNSDECIEVVLPFVAMVGGFSGAVVVGIGALLAGVARGSGRRS